MDLIKYIDGKKHAVCTKCKQTLELTDKNFYRSKNNSKRDGFNYYCKKCSEVMKRKSYNPLKSRNCSLKWLYGITGKEYAQLYIKQNGVCAICGKKNEKKGNKHLVVDHDHKQGEVRGLLCHKCNTGIGQLNDSIEILQNAIKYLEAYNNKPKEIKSYLTREMIKAG